MTSRHRPHGLFILPHRRSAGNFPRKIVPKHSRQLRPIDALVIFATMTTHFSLLVTKLCTNSIRLVLPSSHSHELGAEDTLPLTAFYADYSNWLRSGDSCKLAPISAQISIIFIVPEFQCTTHAGPASHLHLMPLSRLGGVEPPDRWRGL